MNTTLLEKTVTKPSNTDFTSLSAAQITVSDDPKITSSHPFVVLETYSKTDTETNFSCNFNGKIVITRKNGKYSFRNLKTGEFFVNASDIDADHVKIFDGKVIQIEKNGVLSFIELETGRMVTNAQDITEHKFNICYEKAPILNEGKRKIQEIGTSNEYSGNVKNSFISIFRSNGR
jgi:hypothetical protein